MSEYVSRALRVPLSTTLIHIIFPVMYMFNALEGPGDEDRYVPSEEDTARWQLQFNYSRVEALNLIEERRRDFYTDSRLR
jgi:hypothetical protein